MRGTMTLVDQHVTAVAFGADVRAVEIDGGVRLSAGFGSA
jgi:hypothetical protein